MEQIKRINEAVLFQDAILSPLLYSSDIELPFYTLRIQSTFKSAVQNKTLRSFITVYYI